MGIIHRNSTGQDLWIFCTPNSRKRGAGEAATAQSESRPRRYRRYSLERLGILWIGGSSLLFQLGAHSLVKMLVDLLGELQGGVIAHLLVTVIHRLSLIHI